VKANIRLEQNAKLSKPLPPRGSVGAIKQMPFAGYSLPAVYVISKEWYFIVVRRK